MDQGDNVRQFRKREGVVARMNPQGMEVEVTKYVDPFSPGTPAYGISFLDEAAGLGVTVMLDSNGWDKLVHAMSDPTIEERRPDE